MLGGSAVLSAIITYEGLFGRAATLLRLPGWGGAFQALLTFAFVFLLLAPAWLPMVISSRLPRTQRVVRALCGTVLTFGAIVVLHDLPGSHGNWWRYLTAMMLCAVPGLSYLWLCFSPRAFTSTS